MANRMADVVISTAKANNFPPITVVVVDASANIVVQKRMDFCPVVGVSQFAYAKAYTCVAMKISPRAFRDKYASYNPGGIC